ncbi:hypothetical protein O181_010467 [Austropuccinia psidii MF-1]|uniref:Uncharacterized protein n=1 Tax=Austropuccinia psidii MF-1 TaxID=1389203 RepID=A0A9Q3BSP0_9BASI|nr:hypothetical protein [Austropuccinia psidii MF-1]
MEDIFKQFCAYGMEYKDHDWVTLLPACQMVHNTSEYSVKGKSPSKLKKGWSPILQADYLRKNLIILKPIAKEFYAMWKKASDTAAS